MKTAGGKMNISPITGQVSSSQTKGEDKPSGSLKAVFIGIADYAQINDLAYSDDDAIDLKAALEQSTKWQGAEIEILIDKQAPKKEILNSITKYEGKLTSDDTFFFFFSGHGTNDGFNTFICPYDTTMWGKNYLSEMELANALKALAKDPSAPPKIIFMVDSCYSGGLIGKEPDDKEAKAKFFKTPNSVKNIDNNLKEVSKVPNIIAVTASNGREFSYESGKIEQGLFTYHLLNAIGTGAEIGPGDANNDKMISIEEAFKYVEPGVLNHPGFENLQHPQMYDTDDKNEAILKA